VLEVLFQIIEGLLLFGPHSTFAEPLNVLKKGRLLFAGFEMNLFKAVIRHVNFCTSFLVRGVST
jgi:hypothetical protein